MGAQTYQVEVRSIRFPVNQDEIGLDMAVPVIRPTTGKRMIEVAVGQWRIEGEQVPDFHQNRSSALPCRPDFSRL